MWPGTVRRSWRALLCGVALAIFPVDALAVPQEAPPEGFVRENLPGMLASVLRPENWLFRTISPTYYQCSPQAFTGPTEYASGVSIILLRTTDQPADEMAAARIAQMASEHHVIRGWTRKGMPAEPFTTYGLVLVMDVMSDEGTNRKCTCEFVYAANRVTNKVYLCTLYAPVGEWKEVETAGEKMLASFRLDPQF